MPGLDDSYEAALTRALPPSRRLAISRTAPRRPDTELCASLERVQRDIEACERARLRILAERAKTSEPVHLDLCASQDDTMPGHPVCDCGAGPA